MRLNAASRLDIDALSAWINVTVRYIIDKVVQTIKEETDSPYDVRRVGITMISQTEDNGELILIFSVDFDIESLLETYDVEGYVLGAFDDTNAYIEELKNADSSFDSVFDVEVTV
jgi:hypothetical protein